MATITTGVFFLRKAYGVEVAHDAQGFKLTLRLLDRSQPGAVEAYVVTWRGEEAQAWYAAHGAQLRAGIPLEISLRNPRSFPVPGSTETRASVISLKLAPLAPSWMVSPQATAHA